MVCAAGRFRRERFANFSMHTVTSNAAAVSVRAPACAGSIVRRERLRILHVVSCLGMGGTENGVLKIIRGLGDDDFEHRICAVREIDDSFVRRMNFAGEVCSAASSKPGFQFPLFRLISRMKAFRPHVVHARNFGSLEAVAAARLARVPGVVHSEHGSSPGSRPGISALSITEWIRRNSHPAPAPDCECVSNSAFPRRRW
jgi:hypothetical protein